MGCFPHSQNRSYNSPLQICIAGRMLFLKKLKRHVLFKLEQRTLQRKKFIVEPSFLTSWTIENEKCAGAHVQDNKSIYLSIYLSIWKPFWRRVYIYIYIYIRSCTFVRFEKMIWPSIRIDISLQNFKRPLDVFSPQIERKRFQKIFSYNSVCKTKLWPIFLPQVHIWKIKTKQNISGSRLKA